MVIVSFIKLRIVPVDISFMGILHKTWTPNKI